jgi:hypothetical protein
MVHLAAMMLTRPVRHVSQTDAHIVIYLTGNGDGDCDP